MFLPLERSDSFAAEGRMFGIRSVLWFLLDATWFRSKRLLKGISQRFDCIDIETSFEHDSQTFPSSAYPIPRRHFLVLSTEVTQAMKAVNGFDIARAQ
jgi:hypothetical protein